MEKERPTWLRTGTRAAVEEELDKREGRILSELENEIRETNGADTLVIFVVGGALRPAAKADEMSRRTRRQRQVAKRQKPTKCGLKPAEIAGLNGPRTWMESSVS